jgi:hypothetical protein
LLPIAVLNIQQIKEAGYGYIIASRIKARHFVMCFIAFLLEIALEIELKRKGLSISSDRIRQAINTMNYVECEVDERKVYIKTKLTNEAKKILKAVGMKAPANIISEDEVTS